MARFKLSVTKRDGLYVLRIESDRGLQEYRCATELQAARLALVLTGQGIPDSLLAGMPAA